MATKDPGLKWWQKAVFYQIYPRSFADLNGDGIGDFAGMISKLDYLQDLGIDAIWLSPHFPSPMFDCGYDISDYTAVAPEYGTLDDFQRFVDGAHEHGLRVILDLVLNHTSHLHPWFLESRSSKDNPRRDWYIWKDGVGNGPPNNWSSCFDSSAWEFDPLTGQYYYHYFFTQQPDLNWRNPAVKEAMFAAVRFWLNRGVDGFRLDAIGTIFEDPEMHDHPLPYNLVQMHQLGHEAKTEAEKKQFWKLWKEMFTHQVDQPGTHELMKELHQVVDEYEDRMLVAEDENISFHGNGEDELQLVFNFPLLRGEPGTGRLTPRHIRHNQQERLAELAAVSPHAWPCNTLGNHDSPRVYTQYGDGKHNDQQARLSLALMLTLRGTPFLYNGEEIGMSDLMLTNIDQFHDLMGIWYYQAAVRQLGTDPKIALEQAARMTRDKNRTPMQWRNAPHGSFCPPDQQPWLPVNPNYAQGVNVEDQLQDPGSLLNFYRRWLRLRRETPALISGDYLPLLEDNEEILVFLRRTNNQTCLVVLNFSPNLHTVDLREAGSSAYPLFSSRPRSSELLYLGEVQLAPFEILLASVA